MDVLVLNRSYMPLRLVNWQRAFCYLISGKAEVVEAYTNRWIRSAETRWSVPSIVRLTECTANVFSRGVKLSRKNVYLRDRGMCQYCQCKVSQSAFTLDHVVPRVKGGKSVWTNLVVACASCNQKKGHRSGGDSGFKPLKEPVRPKWLPGSEGSLSWRETMPVGWRPYLG